MLVSRPAGLSQERTRIEIAQAPLPKALATAHADVVAVASDDAARQKAAALLADGERAVRSGDRAAMIKASTELNALRDELTREYTLTIVSRRVKARACGGARPMAIERATTI